MLRPAKVLAVTALLAVAAAACGSGSGAGSAPSAGSVGSSSAAPTKTITIGVITDNTGAAASGTKFLEEGIKAGIAAVAGDGYQIKYVVADTQTSPTAALSAAQKLVTQDHVFAVIGVSALFFAAAPYLTAHHVPVIGTAADGPEWATSRNMFSVYGVLHTQQVNDQTGKLIKKLGGTNVGTLGYDISPTSAEAARAGAASAKSVGLQAGYVNAKFPFGSTNVQPVAQAMKDAGVDSVETLTDPNTSFALFTALRNAGVDLKVALGAVGYGADLSQAGPGAMKSAQNVVFGLFYEPMEMNTPATRAFKAALAKVGYTQLPSIAAYHGYASILLLVQGLKNAGANPTQQSLIDSLSRIHAFDAGGLYGSHPLDVNDRQTLVAGPSNCSYYVKLVGADFQTIKGALPLCGKNTGETVSK